MRFRLTLTIDKHAFGSALPLNYQYECSAVIYKILSKSDEAFSTWLHDNGFTSDKKRFKLFTFSRLQAERYRIEGGLLRILSDTVEWHITFLPERSTQEFIQGLFTEQEFELGTQKAKIKCRVQSVEMVAPPMMQETMRFETLSPICIPLKREDGSVEYIAPDHPTAAALIRQNVLDKYRAFTGEEFAAKEFAFDIKTLTPPKSALITVKSGTPEETRVKGFLCRMAVTAPAPLMHVMYNCGIGAKGSLGFGMIEQWRS
ncbi:MAG: CRISPR-associated endoribonuclease Cas6 [Paludibacteraceae bacterium]